MTPEAMARHGNFVRIMRLLDEYGAGINVPGHALALLALQAPEYSGIDYWRWLDGANRGSGPMWDEYRSADLFSDVPAVAVPTFFLSGRQDMNTPLRLVEEYAEFVDAPMGKELVAFDASGHAPFLTEPDRFTVELVRIGDALRGL